MAALVLKIWWSTSRKRLLERPGNLNLTREEERIKSTDNVLTNIEN